MKSEDEKFDIRANALYLTTAAIFLILVIIQIPKHYNGQLTILSSGSIFKAEKDGQWKFETRRDLKNENLALSINEEAGGELFADLELIGQPFKGLKIVISGDVIPQDLLILRECRVQTDGDWQSAKPQYWPHRFTYNFPQVSVQKSLVVRISCEGAKGSYLNPRSGTGEIIFTISPINKRDCKPIIIRRNFILNSVKRPVFQ